MKKHVTLNGKKYFIKYSYDGKMTIYAQWEAHDISSIRWSVYQNTVLRTKAIDTEGRLGKKVLAAASDSYRERLCTPMSVKSAVSLLF